MRMKPTAKKKERKVDRVMKTDFNLTTSLQVNMFRGREQSPNVEEGSKSSPMIRWNS